MSENTLKIIAIRFATGLDATMSQDTISLNLSLEDARDALLKLKDSEVLDVKGIIGLEFEELGEYKNRRVGSPVFRDDLDSITGNGKVSGWCYANVSTKSVFVPSGELKVHFVPSDSQKPVDVSYDEKTQTLAIKSWSIVSAPLIDAVSAKTEALYGDFIDAKRAAWVSKANEKTMKKMEAALLAFTPESARGKLSKAFQKLSDVSVPSSADDLLDEALTKKKQKKVRSAYKSMRSVIEASKMGDYLDASQIEYSVRQITKFPFKMT